MVKKENALVITASQLNEFDVTESLFGPKDQVFVTREQMSRLVSRLYTNLHIFEDCEVSEDSFGQSFIETIVNEATSQAFKTVPIEEVLQSLSPFDLKQDVQPDIIREELSNQLEIKTNGNKSHIVASRSSQISKSDNSNTEIGY